MDSYRSDSIEYWSKENTLQKQKGYFDYASRRMFDSLLPDIKDKTILDDGCGLGMMMDHFLARGNRVFGVDITPSSVLDNKRRGLQCLESDVRYLPFRDNVFDMVYSLGVIEHVKETQLALDEKVRVTKPGGVIVAAVPYLVTPYFLGGLLFELLTRVRFDLRLTYGQAFSKKKFKKMMESAGCEDVQVRSYYGSAFLRVLFDKLHTNTVDKIEESFFSKTFGLLIWGMGRKRKI